MSSEAVSLSPEGAAAIVTVALGFFTAHVVAFISAYVALRVAQARTEVKVDNLEKDMNGLGALVRKIKPETQE